MEGGPQQLFSLLLLGLFAGYFCGELATTVGSTASEQLSVSQPNLSPAEPNLTTAHVANIATQDTATWPATAANLDREPENVSVEPGPASHIIIEGDSAVLECKFLSPPDANVTWKRACSPNCSDSRDVTNTTNRHISVDTKHGLSVLSFHRAEREDTGMYYCFVQHSFNFHQSCGTYLWVRRSRPTSFLNMKESIKNKIITAEGFLLLICAIGPGLFLLFRKRWENERILQTKKKAYEEENLYEGLNLDDCSMYEDISRGLQATYQDIGNVKVIDLQLEKPEKP
ncbi:B-cell antigen receptor complex-associated protein alpha chain [Tiliqua scincoides]|uniref:B-cell antigen receptor complex-associated protein alpha chain n=1 Tax=Tiliqua scincoides TaxID=71010 RepID=UPI003461C5D4